MPTILRTADAWTQLIPSDLNNSESTQGKTLGNTVFNARNDTENKAFFRKNNVNGAPESPIDSANELISNLKSLLVRFDKAPTTSERNPVASDENSSTVDDGNEKSSTVANGNEKSSTAANGNGNGNQALSGSEQTVKPVSRLKTVTEFRQEKINQGLQVFRNLLGDENKYNKVCSRYSEAESQSLPKEDVEEILIFLHAAGEHDQFKGIVKTLADLVIKHGLGPESPLGVCSKHQKGHKAAQQLKSVVANAANELCKGKMLSDVKENIYTFLKVNNYDTNVLSAEDIFTKASRNLDNMSAEIEFNSPGSFLHLGLYNLFIMQLLSLVKDIATPRADEGSVKGPEPETSNKPVPAPAPQPAPQSAPTPQPAPTPQQENGGVPQTIYNINNYYDDHSKVIIQGDTIITRNGGKGNVRGKVFRDGIFTSAGKASARKNHSHPYKNGPDGMPSPNVEVNILGGNVEQQQGFSFPSATGTMNNGGAKQTHSDGGKERARSDGGAERARTDSGTEHTRLDSNIFRSELTVEIEGPHSTGINTPVNHSTPPSATPDNGRSGRSGRNTITEITENGSRSTKSFTRGDGTSQISPDAISPEPKSGSTRTGGSGDPTLGNQLMRISNNSGSVGDTSHFRRPVHLPFPPGGNANGLWKSDSVHQQNPKSAKKIPGDVTTQDNGSTEPPRLHITEELLKKHIQNLRPVRARRPVQADTVDAPVAPDNSSIGSQTPTTPTNSGKSQFTFQGDYNGSPGSATGPGGFSLPPRKKNQARDVIDSHNNSINGQTSTSQENVKWPTVASPARFIGSPDSATSPGGLSQPLIMQNQAGTVNAPHNNSTKEQTPTSPENFKWSPVEPPARYIGGPNSPTRISHLTSGGIATPNAQTKVLVKAGTARPNSFGRPDELRVAKNAPSKKSGTGRSNSVDSGYGSPVSETSADGPGPLPGSSGDSVLTNISSKKLSGENKTHGLNHAPHKKIRGDKFWITAK